MNILVCISVVPDTTTKINFIENNTKFNTQGVQFIINPYDELALTKALEIAEKNNGKVHVIHVGKADSEPVIRKALAMGADTAIRIDAEPIDAQFVAAQIAVVSKQNNYDFILCGRESIDYNGGQLCGLLGELLDIPSINICTVINVENGQAYFEKDIDGGREQLNCALPFVASAQKDLCEPRIPNMRGIMAARTKPLDVLSPVEVSEFSIYEKFDSPQAKQACKMIDASNASLLVDLLRNEAKVI